MTSISEWGNLTLLPVWVHGILLIAAVARGVRDGNSVATLRGRVALVVAALNRLVYGFVRSDDSADRHA